VTLPTWGMTRSGSVYRHPTAERPISGTGAGLLPDNKVFFHTPTCAGLDGGSNSRKALKKRMEHWPTPTVCGNYNRKGASATSGDGLATVVRMFPTPTATNTKANHMRGADKGKPREARNYMATPTARDWRSGKASQATMERNSRPLSEQIGGKLNPNWVEWLMGWPPGWTDLKPLVMDKCRNARLKHGGC